MSATSSAAGEPLGRWLTAHTRAARADSGLPAKLRAASTVSSVSTRSPIRARGAVIKGRRECCEHSRRPALLPGRRVRPAVGRERLFGALVPLGRDKVGSRIVIAAYLDMHAVVLNLIKQRAEVTSRVSGLDLLVCCHGASVVQDIHLVQLPGSSTEGRLNARSRAVASVQAGSRTTMLTSQLRDDAITRSSSRNRGSVKEFPVSLA